ncbi:hypothetical protein [Phytohabitans kaempferiae]|uniref:Uncharacterized protein n=1 Tax=Phytohabitans kaempferiae TaxID=1620943 RepID=A0ABV6MBX3_9ACTN
MLTAVQRDRRGAANQLGHHLTEAARRGINPLVDKPMQMPLRLVPQAPHIIHAAPALAAAPPPDALRIGRDLRGRPVVVVLHADT